MTAIIEVGKIIGYTIGLFIGSVLLFAGIVSAVLVISH